MTRAQKFIKIFDNGMRKSEAARVFNLSRNNIDLWLKRRATTGESRAKKGYQKTLSNSCEARKSYWSYLVFYPPL
jgi:transposase